MRRDVYLLLNIVFVIIFIVLIINLVSAVTYDSFKPYLHKPSIENAPKLQTFGQYQTELFQGGATYSYGIEIPPGTSGLQPSISLTYSSQAALQRPGILGSGWSFADSYIQRNVNHTVNNTADDYFVLALEGNMQKVFYNGTNYNTETNPRSLRIQNFTNNGKIYWNLTDTSGTVYRFGFNNDSLLSSNTGKSYDLKWDLDLVQDVHGNSIFYSYRLNPFSGDNGAIYLANISYNNDKLRLITFEYESSTRSDRRLVYDQGNILDESRRLSGITVYYNSSIVRRYSLTYTDLTPEKSMSAISNISYVGADNSSVLNTINLEYYNTTQSFDNTTNKWLVPGIYAFSSKDTTGQDLGVRLIDVDNDGFPDLIKAKGGATHTTQLNNKVNGWNDSTTLVVPSNLDISDSSGVDQGIRFEDVNGDGLVDILKAKSGTARQVYLNNGTGWNNATSNWSIPLDFVDGNSNDLGVELVDLNGDGKVDIIRAQAASTNITYLNNGTGWQNTTDFKIPDNFVTSDSKDNGLRIIDFNNDGLPDLIKGGEPGSAWINNGTGWVNYPQYAPNLNFTDNAGNRPDLGVRFMDMNGDGLPDILQNFLSNVSYVNQTCIDQNGSVQNCTLYNVTSASNTKLNNGTGWILASGWLSPEKFSNQGFNIGRRISDINGDGYADIIVAYQNSTFENITYIRNVSNAFLLKKITNAYGGTTQVNYKQSTLSNNGNSLGFNIWLVGNSSLNNSMTGDFAAGSQYLYLYDGGKYDYISQEFRGFARVNETLPDNSVTAHSFSQDPILKGRELRTTIYDSNGKLIKDSLNTFTQSSDNMIYLNQTSTQIYDGDPTPVVNNITFDYDNYGNVKKINNSGDVAVSGDEKLELFEYAYNSSTYVVNKPSNYTLYGTNLTLIVKQSLYFYDNLTSGITKGDLIKLRVYNDHGTNPETQYIYDSYGNVLKETQPLGTNTTYTYESTGTYKSMETNVLGQQIIYNYDGGTGNLLSEVRHGLNKTYMYDTFGRIRKEIISPDTVSLPTKNYTYTLDGSAPELIKIEGKNNDTSAYSETLFFYDGFSNLLQTKSLLSGQQVVKNYFYDSKYRIKEEQNPYFDNYSTSISTATTGLRVKYSYDSLDRVTNLTKQDNSSVIITFNKTLVTQTDENSNKIDYILDTYDRIKNVIEYNLNSSGGQEVYNTSYTYRADDKLTVINDTLGNKFIFDYDSLGRKINYDDPNMNNWTYSYDSNSNLINQTDGRNITTFLTYDSINRLTFKKAGNSNITFVYDGQYNGTLTNITSDSDYFDVVYIKYGYDKRLRINETKTYICYREVNPGTNECEWLNVSTDYDSQDRVMNMYMPNTNLNYQYNEIGKIKSINGFLSSINYNAFGKIDNKTYSNSLLTKMDYDGLGRISHLQTGSLQNLSYTYDSVGNVKLINDTKNSKTYMMTYDSLNRLTSTNISNLLTSELQKFSYSYNPISNLLMISTNQKNITYTYSSLAHAPTNVLINFVDCAVIQTPNTVHVLESNVSAAATCIDIRADNVTIDGRGYTIFYSQSSDGYGIYSSGNNNIIIKNLKIVNNRTASINSSGILINGTNINITNVNLNISGRTLSPDSNNYGIFVNLFAKNISIDNTQIITKNRGGKGIYMKGDNQITLISITNTNITTYTGGSNGADGIDLNGLTGLVNDTKISNVIISTNDVNSKGIYVLGSPPASTSGGRTNITNIVITTTSASSSCGISFNNVKEDSFVRNANISASSDNDFCLEGGNTKTVYATNSTYVDESVIAGTLTRQWYYRAFVNNTNGLAVNSTNVTAYNVSNTFQFNLTTDSSGFTSLTNIIDYVNNAGTKTYYSNYTIYAVNPIYTTVSHQINITLSKNVYLDVFTFTSLDTTFPQISFGVGTQNDGASINGSSIYVNVTVNETNEEEIVFSLYNQSVPKSSLVAWYGFEHNLTNQIDNSASGNYATVGNSSSSSLTTPVFITDGKLGNAYEFDGDLDVMEATSIIPFNLNDSATYTAWIRPKLNTTETRRIVSKANSGATTFGGFAMLYPANMKPQCAISNLSGTTLTTTASSIAPLNNWSFVSCVVRRTGTDLNVSIFMNGVLEGSSRGTVTGEIYNSTYNFRIGIPPNSNNFGEFNGTIDEVRVYNTNLSSSDITEIYNSRLVNKTTSTSGQRTINWTNLTSGTYYYNVYVSDTSNNQNITSTRLITLLPPTPSPIYINFTSPTPVNGSSQNATAIYVNVSSNSTQEPHYTFVDFNRDLRLWLRMDDLNSSGGLTDLSSWSNNGTNNGSLTQNNSGAFGNFSSFNNTQGQLINIPHDSSLSFGVYSNITISLWAKIDAFYTKGEVRYLVDKYSGGSDEFGSYTIDNYFVYLRRLPTESDTKIVAGYSGRNSNNGAVCSSSAVVTISSFWNLTGWHHITVPITPGSDVGSIWIDGIQYTKENIDAACSSPELYTYTNANPVTIGNTVNGTKPFKGGADEMTIFARTLNETEIKALYNASANQYYNNFTSLSSGNYSFIGNAVDKMGDKNNTELRTVMIT